MCIRDRSGLCRHTPLCLTFSPARPTAPSNSGHHRPPRHVSAVSSLTAVSAKTVFLKKHIGWNKNAGYEFTANYNGNNYAQIIDVSRTTSTQKITSSTGTRQQSHRPWVWQNYTVDQGGCQDSSGEPRCYEQRWRRLPVESREKFTSRAKFHYASWFEAGRRPASNQLA